MLPRTMHRRQGFTLLEIMVVMVIVAVLAAIVTPNLFAARNRGKDLETEAAALAARIQVAQDDAMLYGHEYGIVFSDDGYRFVRWDTKANRFRSVDGDDEEWTRRTLAAAVKVSASATGSEPILVVPEKKKDDVTALTASTGTGPQGKTADEQDWKPSVFVLSSGEVTPFTARFNAEGAAEPLDLSIDALGNRVYPPGSAPPDATGEGNARDDAHAS